MAITIVSRLLHKKTHITHLPTPMVSRETKTRTICRPGESSSREKLSSILGNDNNIEVLFSNRLKFNQLSKIKILLSWELTNICANWYENIFFIPVSWYKLEKKVQVLNHNYWYWTSTTGTENFPRKSTEPYQIYCGLVLCVFLFRVWRIMNRFSRKFFVTLSQAWKKKHKTRHTM